MINSAENWAKLREQVEKAERRAREEGLNLKTLADTPVDTKPDQLAPVDALAERENMLRDTQGNTRGAIAFERLIAGDELQAINYLPRGIVAARPIGRITVADAADNAREYGSGFLIAPGVLLTNNHVFPTLDSAKYSFVEFDYERDVFDDLKKAQRFNLRPELLFETSVKLDFSVVAVAPIGREGTSLANYGYLPLIAETGKAVEGEWLTVIQHPEGREKQVCIRENKLLKRGDDVLWYSTDTLPGSSGAPVFNNSWQVVALHHSGVPETKNGKWQTVDGRDFDERRDDPRQVKWLCNEGIRISRVVGELKRLNPASPLLEPVFNMSLERALAVTNDFARGLNTPGATRASPVSSTPVPNPQSAAARTVSTMAKQSITVTFDIEDDGRVSIRPGSGRSQESFGAQEAAALAAGAAAAARSETDLDVPPVTDYKVGGPRTGYQENFLKAKGETAAQAAPFKVPLPSLGALANEALAISKPGPNGKFVLDYLGYSLVMHEKRKFAIYTAANVDGGNRFHLDRPADVWKFDPRIPRTAQIGEAYYAANLFDKGHLTRREDMEYGDDPTDCLQRAADTMHFTNRVPQHAKFNRGKQLWQGLERHILELSLEGAKFAAQVFTGPVLDDNDPKYKDVQYPLKFWKVAVARARPGGARQDKLFAAAFVLDQTDVIAQFGIEEAAAVPFAPFKTFQVSIQEIERLTGLTFTGGKGQSLSDFDPLASGPTARAARRRRGGARLQESAALAGQFAPPGYVPLEDRFDLILDD
jgi:endonuclease G